MTTPTVQVAIPSDVYREYKELMLEMTIIAAQCAPDTMTHQIAKLVSTGGFAYLIRAGAMASRSAIAPAASSDTAQLIKQFSAHSLEAKSASLSDEQRLEHLVATSLRGIGAAITEKVMLSNAAAPEPAEPG